MLWAHAYLVKSVPAQRAVLHRARAKIQLWFNERLDGLPLPLIIGDALTARMDRLKAYIHHPINGTRPHLFDYFVINVDELLRSNWLKLK